MLGKFLEGKYVFPRVVLLVDRHSLIFPYIFIGYFLLCLEIGFVEPKIRFSVFSTLNVILLASFVFFCDLLDQLVPLVFCHIHP